MCVPVCEKLLGGTREQEPRPASAEQPSEQPEHDDGRDGHEAEQHGHDRNGSPHAARHAAAQGAMAAGLTAAPVCLRRAPRGARQAVAQAAHPAAPDPRAGDPRRARQAAAVTGLAMTNRPPRFEAERAPLPGPPGVIVRGEVDIGTVSELTLALDEAIRDSAGAFVVDLRGVDFLDSTGVMC